MSALLDARILQNTVFAEKRSTNDRLLLQPTTRLHLDLFGQLDLLSVTEWGGIEEGAEWYEAVDQWLECLWGFKD